MSDGDLFREVDQAVRQERYRLIWDRFGYYILAVAALIVLVVAGYRGWVYWQEKQAKETGAEFVSALELAQAQNTEKAEKAFEKLAEDAPQGYETLARFQIAAAEADAGKTKEAVAKYDAIAEDGSVDPILRGNAIVQAATLRLPEADYAEMERRLEPLINENSPWRYSAHDLLGLSAYRTGDMETAQDHFNTLLADSGTPANMREQTTVMLAVISGALSTGETPGGTKDSPAPQDAPAEGAAAPTTDAPAAETSPAEDSAPSAGTPEPDAAAQPAETPAAAEPPAAESGTADDASSATDNSSLSDDAAPSTESAPSTGASDNGAAAPSGDGAETQPSPEEETPPAGSN
ncbi:hypothetical protein A7A08_02596 [Methyloligella halotolerans]|uniref:Ancillary SecYEG translocon subunit/Cell division coordinator CpoB TPR domain-containing protein n=1 Tax=Methyloligella halotolerans TaxID=1177755 RepID=A0A1E2RW84_9HYPH|nr:tetratricopeptide repeat protein [Methyloligella halotolerans]ODA66473.1 hypothetical protein A7A08_02596 [Methyloligella halotolerans]